MAAVFNFLGVLVMTAVNASVAARPSTTWWISAATPPDALTALCAALVAIVAWATAAWVVRHPHQREPRPDRRAFRGGHRPARGALRDQRRRMGQGPLRAGSVYPAGLCIGCGCDQGWWSSCCRRHGPAADPGLFRGAQIARRSCHGLHARRTGRAEVHGRFHAGHLFWPAGRTERHQLSRSRFG